MLFRVSAADQTVLLDDNEVVIGRSPYCSIILCDESVSSVHVVLSRRIDQVEITDMNTSNGTFVNDKRITDSVFVVTTDEIRVGDVQVKIETFERPVAGDSM